MLAPWKESYDKPRQCIKKQRHLPTKLCIVKTTILPIVTYGCENWTIKKAESWRIDAFELWSWRRLLRVSWTAKRSNQSHLKEINPDYSLEGLKVKLWYFGHVMQRANSLEKTMMLGKIEGRLNIQKTKMMFMANRWGNSGKSNRLDFGGSKITAGGWLQPWN